MDTTRQGPGIGRPQPVDADPRNRPGVPFYQPRLASPDRTPTITPQDSGEEVLVGVEAALQPNVEPSTGLTPVYGTAIPPRGLSGVVRRAAYEIPEHRADRWMLLMLGDRIDVVESAIRRNPIAVGALLGGAVALFVLSRQRRGFGGARRFGWADAIRDAL